jgi:FMN reductase (NADPH)
MSTPTIELMHGHWSVRDYRDEPVLADQIEAVLAAGQRASTSSNLQTYSVVVVQDPDRKARLAELCGSQEQIYQAPVFLAWCADLARLGRVCQMRGYEQANGYVEDFLVGVMDAALAMQNAALAAESLGLGICYIGAIRNNPREVIELLGLPRLVFPVSGMTLGWPVAEPFIRPRLPLEAVLHWERYDTAGEAEALEAYDQAMIETGIYQGRQVPVPGIEEEMEAYGWLEHSARRASRPVRTHLRENLHRQGFELK